MQRRILLQLTIAMLIKFVLSVAHAGTSGEAFGLPGAAAVHGPAQKSFIGTVLNPASQVSFTGYRGVVSEVYHPVLDTSETVNLQFPHGRPKMIAEAERQCPACRDNLRLVLQAAGRALEDVVDMTTYPVHS